MDDTSATLLTLPLHTPIPRHCLSHLPPPPQDTDKAASPQGLSHRSPYANPPPYGSNNHRDYSDYQPGPPKGDDYNNNNDYYQSNAAKISVANSRFLQLAKNAQKLLRDAIASGGSVTPEAYGAIRIEMQQVLNINQVCWAVAIMLSVCDVLFVGYTPDNCHGMCT